MADFKPVLHIKGAVYNRAHRGVNVPDLLVSIKDDDPRFDKEFPASLPVEGGSIEPGERAEFEIELLSPSATISTVELQLRERALPSHARIPAPEIPPAAGGR